MTQGLFLERRVCGARKEGLRCLEKRVLGEAGAWRSECLGAFPSPANVARTTRGSRQLSVHWGRADSSPAGADLTGRGGLWVENFGDLLTFGRAIKG
ncbi:hypothetical protein ACFX1X_012660 [Malus domestica]